MRNRQKIVKVNKQPRYLFYGTFDRYIITKGFRGIGQQMVFRNVSSENGEISATYVQFDNIKTFLELNLREGDIVRFYARVVVCQNAQEAIYGFYNPYSMAYVRLMNPTKAIKLISTVKRYSSIVEPVEKLPYRVHITPRK